MIKRLLKILAVLVVLAAVIAGVFFYGIFVSVERVNIDYQSISSKQIPKDLNNVQIAFVSDIHYNGYMKKDRLNKMISKLNEAHPDVVIFGGDLFDHPELNMPSIEIQNEIREILSGIDAPLGKFAILGEQDLMNEEIKAMVTQILYDSNFEVLENRSIRLRNKTSSSIALIGVDSLIGGVPNVEAAFQNIAQNDFVIAVSHAPDIVASLPMESVDLMFAGHSHGGQIAIPFMGPLKKIQGAENYSYGKYEIKGALLQVSNGLGTTDMDMRLFAPPQIPIYRLISEES